MNLFVRVMDYCSTLIVNMCLFYIIIISFSSWLISITAAFWLFMRLRDLIEKEELLQRLKQPQKKRKK